MFECSPEGIVHLTVFHLNILRPLTDQYQNIKIAPFVLEGPLLDEVVGHILEATSSKGGVKLGLSVKVTLIQHELFHTARSVRDGRGDGPRQQKDDMLQGDEYKGIQFSYIYFMKMILCTSLAKTSGVLFSN